MGEYLQTQRKGRVTGLLGEDDFLLRSFAGVDAVSRLFRFEIELLADVRRRVPFDKVLGQRATVHLALPDGSENRFNGLCVKFSQGPRDQLFTLYRAVLVPDAWLLTKRAQSRIFQRLTVPEILKKVLVGFGVKWELRRRYEPREYCVQYRETDFAFASRLMEEEGIAFFFEHSDGSHTMVLADDPNAHPRVPGLSSIVYEELAGGYRDDDRITAWEKTQEVRSTRFVLWDHAFEMPHKHLESESIILDSVAVGEEIHKLRLPGTENLEVFDWPGGFAHDFDGIGKGGGEQQPELQKTFPEGARTVELRMDEETVPAIVVHGAGQAKNLVAGHRFALERHFNANGEYLLLSVEHEARFGADLRATGAEPGSYHNTFTCMPAGLRYRPPRSTPKPVVRGCQTAIVVGPPGEEIFCDKYGRVKVQFHWDREEKGNDDSSCWIRVGTPWAGKQWGAIHIPRVGHEVIVEFLEGDPDRPIIIGSVYNADMMPPYSLPENKTQSGIRSRSSMKGTPANCNEFRFEDRKGSEEVLLHAERQLTTEVEADESRTVGHDRTTGIGHDDTLKVAAKRTTEVGADDTLKVAAKRTTEVGADDTWTVGGNRSATVAGSDTLKVQGKQKIEVGGDRDATVSGREDLVVQGGRLTGIAGNDELKVKGDISMFGANVKASALDGTVDLLGDKINVDAGGPLILSGGAGVFLGSRGPMTVSSKSIVIFGDVCVFGKLTATSLEAATAVISPAYSKGVGNAV